MAAIDQQHPPVSEALVREHAQIWHVFTRMISLAVAATILLLLMMAMFLA
jgi:hypothetical protein